MKQEIIAIIVYAVITAISVWYMWKMISKCVDAKDLEVARIYYYLCYIGMAAFGINFSCLVVHIINLIKAFVQ